MNATVKIIHSLVEPAKKLARENNRSYTDTLENTLLGYCNVWRNEYGHVMVRLRNGNHVNLWLDIIK